MRQRERQQRVLERLMAGGSATVVELADDLGVTQSTIRRDLQLLAEEGRLVRTYGGAAVTGPAPVAPDDATTDAKRRIGRLAATLVVDGQTIVIGSGSTAIEFARCIADRRLTVITNALDIANLLVDREGIELIILGGVVRPRMHRLLGHLAELATRELRADTLFMGIGAVSLRHGLMNDSVPEILTDRALRRMARSVVVLADSTKFEHVEAGFVFGLDEVDVLVTDVPPRPADAAGLEAAGVRVLVAPAGPASGPGDRP